MNMINYFLFTLSIKAWNSFTDSLNPYPDWGGGVDVTHTPINPSAQNTRNKKKMKKEDSKNDPPQSPTPHQHAAIYRIYETLLLIRRRGWQKRAKCLGKF